MRAILAGGGTGGHVIPAIAIAQQLRENYGAEVIFIGTERGIETRLVPKAGFALRLIDVGQLSRVSLSTRFKTLTALPRAIAAAWSIMTDFRPDVVVGVGGYASGPAMLAAALRGTASLIFEPNVVPGFANRMVAPMAKAAAVHFEQTCRWFQNCEVTGVPVRREFFDIPRRGPGSAPTLLLFGGSQGSHALNQVLVESLSALMERVPRSARKGAAEATIIGTNYYFATVRTLAALHDAGLEVWLFTVNKPRQIARAIAMGADGVISDFPERVPKGSGR